MLFNGELIRFKSMKDALRLEIDVPKMDAIRVMQHITNFIDKPLLIDMNIDSAGAVVSFVAITDDQVKKIQACYTDLATKYNVSRDDTIKRVKKALLGKEDTSITELSKLQASAYIDQLEDMLNKKQGG